VAKIEILSEPGGGLGSAGARAIRERFRFNPGKVNGRPVATTITFKVRFTLD
jgi:TonB-like protein